MIWVKERESHNYVIATNRDALAASGATSALPVPFGSETGALIFSRNNNVRPPRACLLPTCYALRANPLRAYSQWLGLRSTLTSNQVRLRGSFFIVSAIVLAVMWLIYIVEMLTSPWV